MRFGSAGQQRLNRRGRIGANLHCSAERIGWYSNGTCCLCSSALFNWHPRFNIEGVHCDASHHPPVSRPLFFFFFFFTHRHCVHTHAYLLSSSLSLVLWETIGTLSSFLLSYCLLQTEDNRPSSLRRLGVLTSPHDRCSPRTNQMCCSLFSRPLA